MNPRTALVFGLVAANVLLRAFTNKLGILPRALNTIDVPLALVLFLYSLRFPHQPFPHQPPIRFGKRLLLFNLILLAGALLNWDFCHLPAALSQWVMWNEPLLVMLAIMRMPFSRAEIDSFARLLSRLLVLQVVIGFLQFPIYLKTGHTEEMVGTFFGNAEQYQAFIMLALYFLLAKTALEPGRKRPLWLMIGSILVLILLIDNKASWLGLLTSFALVFKLTQDEHRASLVSLRFLVPVGVLATVATTVVLTFSPSVGKLTTTLTRLASPDFWKFGKTQAYLDVAQAFADHPHMALVGSGPGCFYSRAGRQFYYAAFALFEGGMNLEFVATDRQSNALGGLTRGMMGSNPFYLQFYQDREINRVGSAKLDEPFSSFAALIGETGILGTLLYLSIYVSAARTLLASIKSRVPLPTSRYILALCGLGLLVAMVTNSAYWNWLETGRITTILWAVVAMGAKQAIDDPDDDVTPEEEYHSSTPNPA